MEFMNSYIIKCNNLSWEIKMKIWVYYLCQQGKLIVYTYYKYIDGKFVYAENPFKQTEISSFEEFCTNYEEINIGKNWKKQGYAQEKWIEYPINSLYYWYYKLY